MPPKPDPGFFLPSRQVQAQTRLVTTDPRQGQRQGDHVTLVEIGRAAHKIV